MSLYAQYAALLDGVLDDLVADGTLPAELDRKHVTVEPPRDPAHGDLATNAAMVLAKAAKTNPRALAEAIKPKLEALPPVTSVEIAGPGFINLRLKSDAWRDELRTILREGDDYGLSKVGADERVNVEYVSANPTGPLHMGHCRGAVVGDSLARLLEAAGFRVTKEYYVNDAGAQVDTLARSVHLRYREALGEKIGEIAEGFYPGDYLKPVGAQLAGEFGDRYANAPESEWLDLFKRRSVAAMLDLIRHDLALLGVHHDLFASEREVQESGAVDRALKVLDERGLVYRGMLPPPRGKTAEDWEPKELLLFRSTAVRRRPGSTDQEIRRQLDLFRGGHRLSHAETRKLARIGQHLGRRPCRHREAHAGRGRGARRPPDARRETGADGSAAARWRVGEDVEALRQLRNSGRGGRGSR